MPVKINPGKNTPKYLQIVDSISQAIVKGQLRKGDQVFSINEFSGEHLMCRVTVQKAYNILRKKGILVSIPGKGFYVNRTDLAVRYRVLLLFNKISHYKKQIYNAFVGAMGSQATVDLQIHHSDLRVFEHQLEELQDEYDYYVVIPHFCETPEKVEAVLRKLPAEKLVLLDKDLLNFHHLMGAVYQDFKKDIYDSLEQGADLLDKYRELILVQPGGTPHPPEIAVGIRNYCINNRFRYRSLPCIAFDLEPAAGEVYIVIEETDLVNLIKRCRESGLVIGKDVGIISYNDLPFKEILLDGITVISTDHSRMGEMAAQLLLQNKKERIRIPFSLIRRKSL